MTVTFTFVPTTNRGQIRTAIQDTNVGNLVNRLTSGIAGNVITLNTTTMVINELVGEFIFSDITGYDKYRIVSNTISSVTVKGDLGTVLASAAPTSAIVNEALFTDEEIDAFYTQANSNILRASALGIRAITASQALLAKRFKRTGVGGVEVDQHNLKELIALADSYEKQADNYAPGSCVNSMETGVQKRNDDFETDDYNEFGQDLTEYSRT